MGHASDTQAILANQQDLVIGLTPRSPIPAGTLLNTGLSSSRRTTSVPDFVVVEHVRRRRGRHRHSRLVNDVAILAVTRQPIGG
jgi:hypothetical protein